MTRLLSLLIALLVAATAAGQTLEERREAVVEFSRYFKKYREVAQRVEAIHSLEGMDCVEAAAVLLDLVEDREPDVRAAAMQVVGTFRRLETFQSLIDGLPQQRDQARRALWVEVLTRARIKQVVPVLVAMLAEDKKLKAAVKYRIAVALGELGDASATESLRTLLRDRDPMVCLGASDAVGRLAVAELAPEVIRLLEHDRWQVRSSAVATLGILRPQAAVTPLIELMKQGGRLMEDAAEALFLITSLDFGVNPEVWEVQWAKLMELDWRIPTAAELEKAKESRRRDDAYYGKESGATSFGGIPTTSRRVMFVIDVSGSMDDRVVEVERFKAGYADLSKLTIVKTELLRTIDSLDRNTSFNVVAFASDLTPWKKKLVPANIVNKSSAKAWVERRQALGGRQAQDLAAAGLTGTANLAAGKTNTFKALMYPFGIDPGDRRRQGKTAGGSRRGGIDTVYFLSDGRPSAGKLVDTMEILAAVNEVNASAKIVIHAIAIGDFQRDFLRGLARDNGGVFVDLGR